MKKETSQRDQLRDRMKSMKTNGIPIFVDTNDERIVAHQEAARLKIEIATRKRLGRAGYEIFRMK
jgi:hypothetical protein